MAQAYEHPLRSKNISSKNVKKFIYLGTIVKDNNSHDKGIDRCIGKAAVTMYKLSNRIFHNRRLSVRMKIAIYKACVINLLYSSEAWVTYACQEKLHIYHI